jgi:exonuclease I
MIGKTVFFDLETGGLNSAIHPVTQAAFVAIGPDWQELEALEVKVIFDPAQCEAEALALNSYDPEVWAREAIAADLAQIKIASFLRRHATVRKVSKNSGKPYLVARMAAYNGHFDGEFIAEWFKSTGTFLPGACYESRDPLGLSRWVADLDEVVLDNHRLVTVAAWLGVPLPDAHDALADVRATVEVARLLCERIGR